MGGRSRSTRSARCSAGIKACLRKISGRAFHSRMVCWPSLGLALSFWPAIAYPAPGAAEGSTNRAWEGHFSPNEVRLAALSRRHCMRLRGGSDEDARAEPSSNMAESPNEYPHIPTDELSEDERETLYMFRNVQRQYYEGGMSSGARQEFENWMATETAGLQQDMETFEDEQKIAEDKPIAPLNLTQIRSGADMAVACDALAEACDELKVELEGLQASTKGPFTAVEAVKTNPVVEDVDPRGGERIPQRQGIRLSEGTVGRSRKSDWESERRGLQERNSRSSDFGITGCEGNGEGDTGVVRDVGRRLSPRGTGFVGPGQSDEGGASGQNDLMDLSTPRY